MNVSYLIALLLTFSALTTYLKYRFWRFPARIGSSRQLRACHELKANVLNKLLSKRLLKASQCSALRVVGNRS